MCYHEHKATINSIVILIVFINNKKLIIKISSMNKSNR